MIDSIKPPESRRVAQPSTTGAETTPPDVVPRRLAEGSAGHVVNDSYERSRPSSFATLVEGHPPSPQGSAGPGGSTAATSQGFGPGSPVRNDTERRGRDLVQQGLRSPAETRADVLRQLESSGSTGDDDFSRGFCSGMTADQLADYASHPDGRAVLQQMRSRMESGWTGSDDRQQISRIDCALRRAEIRSDSNIRAPEARQALERAISRRDGNAEWARQVRELSTSQDFRARDEALQERAASRISAHPDIRELGSVQRELANNQGLSDELRQMRSDPAFQGLRPPDRQRAVINDMIRFAETPSFREMERQGRGRQALGIIGNLSVHASSTGNAVERNTVDSLASGRTNMDIVDDPTLFHSPDDLALAHHESNTIVFNARRANSQSPRDDLAEIAAHEVNHLRSGPTTAGTRERFLDEYRAYWTGRQARGGSGPSAADIRGQMENLATDQGRGSPYDGTRDLYRSDPRFRSVVDRLVSDANRNPPVLHDPEEVRRLLAAARPQNAGAAGGYIDRPENVDNHG